MCVLRSYKLGQKYIALSRILFTVFLRVFYLNENNNYLNFNKKSYDLLLNNNDLMKQYRLFIFLLLYLIFIFLSFCKMLKYQGDLK